MCIHFSSLLIKAPAAQQLEIQRKTQCL